MSWGGKGAILLAMLSQRLFGMTSSECLISDLQTVYNTDNITWYAAAMAHPLNDLLMQVPLQCSNVHTV